MGDHPVSHPVECLQVDLLRCPYLYEAHRRPSDGFRNGFRVDDVVLVSIDKRGVDARVRRGTDFGIERLSFLNNGLEVDTLETASKALEELLLTKKNSLL